MNLVLKIGHQPGVYVPLRALFLVKHLFLILGFEMEEEPYDPRELFADIALLITEARTPDQSKKGRVEGPHCPPVQGNRGHDCDRHKEQVT